MSADFSTRSMHSTAMADPRRHFLCVALIVSALANALVPTVFFYETSLFGQTAPRYHALIVVVVVAEYTIAFFFMPE